MQEAEAAVHGKAYLAAAAAEATADMQIELDDIQEGDEASWAVLVVDSRELEMEV